MYIGVCPEVAGYTLPITELAKAVEDAGLESLLFMQRTHVPASRRALLADPFHAIDADLLDPFVAAGVAAAVTSHVNVGTGVCQVVVYDPIILAKQVATLDQISGGRFLFGVGTGWVEEELRNHGVEPALRWRVMREKVLAMRALWTEPDAEFHGRFVDFAPVVRLKPVQQPHPPVLLGGSGRHALARVVEYGDGWLPVLHDELEENMQELARLCQLAGRAPAPVSVIVLELDEAAVERCATAGVTRCAVYMSGQRDQAELRSFLQRCSVLARHFGE